MCFAYWSHADDLAIKQFDSFGRGKDSRFGEFIILGDREFSQLGLKNGGHEVGCRALNCRYLPREARRECESRDLVRDDLRKIEIAKACKCSATQAAFTNALEHLPSSSRGSAAKANLTVGRPKNLHQYPSERIYSRLRLADSFGFPIPG